MNTPYRQRQIEKRVLATLLAMGFEYINETERYFKIYGLVFRVQLTAWPNSNGSWYLRLRDDKGQAVDGFPLETSFITAFKDEAAIGQAIMQWVYDTAYAVGKSNKQKQINKELKKLIEE